MLRRRNAAVRVDVAASAEEAVDGVDGVVNGTPVGMYFQPGTPVDLAAIRDQQWLFDAIYSPIETELMARAADAKLTRISGFDLFLGQGIDAFEIFTGYVLAPPVLEDLETPDAGPRTRTHVLTVRTHQSQGGQDAREDVRWTEVIFRLTPLACTAADRGGLGRMTSAHTPRIAWPAPPHRRHRRLRPALAVGIALATVVPAVASTAAAAPPSATSATEPDLGSNVIVFDPSMPVGEIQATVDAINAQQIDSEMGTNRYALLFEPGVYGTLTEPLQMKVGYYTEVAGLGASPTDVVINGKIEVYNRCLENGGTSNCLALVNFWRTLSNLTLNINAAGQDGCRASANFWAVSQAVSMRRVDVSGGNPVADGLLHRRSAVRQWGLHRRLQERARHQRLAAAVADPQQRDRQLVQRRLERGLRRRRGCPDRRVLPGPAVHDARRESAEP